MIYLMKQSQMTSCYIAHHGIKGQKWGVKNGPPYPLSAGDHSSAEKKAGGTRYGASKSSGSDDSIKRDDGIDRSNKNDAWKFMLRAAFDLATFRPVAMSQDISRFGQYLMAQNKTKKVTKRLAENTNIDKETGLKLKNKEFTEKEDMAQVNPSYANFDRDSKHNCMLCTSTYELRRRGYDVTANKVGLGYTDTTVADWFKGAKLISHNSDIDKDGKITKEGITRMRNAKWGMNTAGAREAIEALKKEPNGSRGNIMVNWTQTAGHSMVYEVKDGNVIIRDCQSNKVYNNPEKILKSSFNIRTARLDNLEINKKKIKEVCHS